MTELRGTARMTKPNIETLEGRTMLSSVVDLGVGPICIDRNGGKAPVQPAITTNSGGERKMTTMSLGGVPVGSSPLGMELAAAQLALENALAAAARGAEFGAHGAFPGVHPGVSYNDMDGDDGAVRIIHNSGERLAPPIHERGVTFYPGEGANTPQNPAGANSSSSSTSTGVPSAAPALNVAAHGSTSPATLSSITAIPPRSPRITPQDPGQEGFSAASVVDSLVARVTPLATAPLNVSHVISGELLTTGEIGGSLSTAIAKIAAEYAQVAAEAARIARGVITAPAQVVPTVAQTFSTIGEVAQVPQRLFHFERMSDPMALIGDSAAEFAEESALLGVSGGQARYAKAWAITGGVVLLDAAVLVYYIQTRRRRHVAAQSWAYAMTGGEVE